MVKIEQLSLKVGTFELQNITLHIARGEYFVLLGKPGSGKTLLLECLAGLRRPSAGRIIIDGVDMNGVEPGRRGIGYVPQDYALFSSKTVRGNIEFPLKARRLPRAQRRQRIKELAQMLGIEYLLDRRVQGLSGGERQRVALARALAAEPKILALDEPVSALDRETRDEILAELKRVQQQTGVTVIHVCHDLDEMWSVAEKVGVLSKGRLLQTGTPAQVTQTPASPEIARLLDLGTVLEGTAWPTHKGTVVDLGGVQVLSRSKANGNVSLLIRSTAVRFTSPDHDDAIKATVEAVTKREMAALIHLRVGKVAFKVRIGREDGEEVQFRAGDTVWVTIPPEAVHIFPESHQ